MSIDYGPYKNWLYGFDAVEPIHTHTRLVIRRSPAPSRWQRFLHFIIGRPDPRPSVWLETLR